MKKIKYIVAPFIALSPLIVFAQSSSEKDLKWLIGEISGYLNTILALMMGVAVVFFVFNVIKYFILKSDAERKEANTYIMWSLIGFFIILSFWGLVNILTATFNLGPNAPSNWTDFGSIFPK